MPAVIILGLFVLLVAFLMSFIMGRYKRVPANKVLVIYGKTEKGGEPVCLTEGAHFVWPVIQDFAYLDLTAMRLDIQLKGIRNRQKDIINVFAQATVAISNDEDLVLEAANRFLGKPNKEIGLIAQDIISSQIKRDISTMKIEDFNEDWESTSGFIAYNITKALNEIGLDLINIHITDIQRNKGNITEIH